MKEHQITDIPANNDKPLFNVYDILMNRGYIAQVSHEEEIRALLSNEKLTFYIGFDPTADSLHVGHFLQMMVMAHMQKAGHRPIAIIGGGTTMVGDPTGKTDMRKMLTREEIQYNANRFRVQFSKFIDFDLSGALMIDNSDWLLELNYVNFLREIGVHFSVNRMLSAECFRSRLEKGLSFIEFNYMLMQSYDFLVLFRDYGCKLQLGGDDQWSNILGGVDLIRRVMGASAFGMTFNLLTNSEGKKMGKTEKGALWLDAEKTSPYDFYQYWRNTHDEDVEKCLKLLTFLPLSEIAVLCDSSKNNINYAKKVLAFEVSKLIHGENEAVQAKEASEALFGTGIISDRIPTTSVSQEQLQNGISILELLCIGGLAPSRAEAKRLINQGGISVNDEKITSPDTLFTSENFKNTGLLIKKGKKHFQKYLLNADNLS